MCRHKVGFISYGRNNFCVKYNYLIKVQAYKQNGKCDLCKYATVCLKKSLKTNMIDSFGF